MYTNYLLMVFTSKNDVFLSIGKETAMIKTTIHDVASTAGVSVATVDRVLNNRAGVRAATREKVHDAMRRLNYKPNTFAARLSKSRSYRFLFIVPSGHNPFMDTVDVMVDAAAAAGKTENLFIERRSVEAFDGVALSNLLESLSPERWDGVAVVVPDMPLVRQAINTCIENGIKLVTLISDLPSSMRPFYVGIDNMSAGHVAGRLLGRFTAGRAGKLAVICGSLTLSDHMARFMGCGQVVRNHFPHLEVLSPVEGRDNDGDTKAAAEDLLRKYGEEIVGLYNVGAGSQGLIAALEESGRKDGIVVVAHELSPQSRKALLDGTFDAVLCQNAAYEVERAVTLLRQLCDGEKDIRNSFVRTDIFLPDNLY